MTRALSTRRARAARRRLGRRPTRAIALVSVSLIDIVFLLLIYFLVTGHFQRAEEVFPLLAQSAPAAEDPLVLAEDPLTVRVLSGSRGFVLGGEMAPAESAAALEARLHEMILGGSRGVLAPTHPVLIMPDEDAWWDDVVQGYNALLQSGLRNISFGRGA